MDAGLGGRGGGGRWPKSDIGQGKGQSGSLLGEPFPAGYARFRPFLDRVEKTRSLRNHTFAGGTICAGEPGLPRERGDALEKLWGLV